MLHYAKRIIEFKDCELVFREKESALKKLSALEDGRAFYILGLGTYLKFSSNIMSPEEYKKRKRKTSYKKFVRSKLGIERQSTDKDFFYENRPG